MIDFEGSKLYKPGVNYYEQTDFVSNSTFNTLRDWLNNSPPLNLEAAFAFGNLVDAIMTEPALVDRANCRVNLADGNPYQFSPAHFEQADKMIDAAYADPMAAMLLKQMDFQYEKYIDTFRFNYHGREFTLPMRLKMDGFSKRINTAVDIKTTSCTSLKAFKESLHDLNYDRQGALYMDGSGASKFWFIGLGKIPDRRGKYPVFIHAFKRGDEFYEMGKNKYTFWAHLYEALIYNLNTSLF